MKVIDYRQNSLVTTSTTQETSQSPLSSKAGETTSCSILLQSQTATLAESHSNFVLEDSSTCMETEEDVTDDIYKMMMHMAKKASDRLSRYQHKSNKALSEAKDQYVNKASTTKALNYMRKYSTYKLRVKSMMSARGELVAMMRKVEDNIMQQGSASPELLNALPGKLRRLQVMLTDSPTATQSSRRLLQELEAIIEEDKILAGDDDLSLASRDL